MARASVADDSFSLESYFTRLKEAEPAPVRGHVVRSVGLLVESHGPAASVGEICEIRTGRVSKMRWHLTFCDFCAAEFDLYLRFPPGDEIVETPQIPKHLFDLAESILKRKKLSLPADRRASRRA